MEVLAGMAAVKRIHQLAQSSQHEGGGLPAKKASRWLGCQRRTIGTPQYRPSCSCYIIDKPKPSSTALAPLAPLHSSVTRAGLLGLDRIQEAQGVARFPLAPSPRSACSTGMVWACAAALSLFLLPVGCCSVAAAVVALNSWCKGGIYLAGLLRNFSSLLGPEV